MYRIKYRINFAAVAVALSWLGAPAGTEGQELIAPGHESLKAPVFEDHVAVWAFERMANDEATTLGEFERRMERVTHRPNEPSILTRWHVTFPGRSALDIYYADSSTLALSARYQTASNGMWVMYFDGTRIHGSLTRSDGEPFLFDVEAESELFNGAMVDLVLATLPLEDGFTANLPIVGSNSESMEEGVRGRVTVTVEGRSQLETAAGDFDAWIVRQQRNDVRDQILYIATEPPFLIRRDILDGDGNVTARWTLRRVVIGGMD